MRKKQVDKALLKPKKELNLSLEATKSIKLKQLSTA